MAELDDNSLLRQYADSGSETAFSALVERHVNLVYSAALRRAGNPHAAEEISQAVFIILARKAKSLAAGTVLSGWLYQTTRLTAANFLRGEIRRQCREQEASMQSFLGESAANDAWRQIAPLLDEAMGRIGERDRNAIVLRFFENKSLQEVGGKMGTSEGAAKMRVNRALEKLRKFLGKRGISSTTAIIAGAISANSVHAAPVGLAKTISAIALAKGAAASTSTLTLVKGALKIMAWTKAKTVVVAGAVVVLAAGTTTVTVKEIQQHDLDSKWDIGRIDSRILDNAPHIVRIIATKFPNTGGWASVSDSLGNDRIIGIGESAETMIEAAYGVSHTRTVYAATPPKQKKFDFLSNLATGSNEAFQRTIEKRFGIAVRRETIVTNVLFLRVETSNMPGLRLTSTRSSSSSYRAENQFSFVNQQIGSIVNFAESRFGTPVVDQTGLTGNYDADLNWQWDDPQHENLKQALKDQLGLELVPGTAPVEMLVVDKAN